MEIGYSNPVTCLDKNLIRFTCANDLFSAFELKPNSINLKFRDITVLIV